MLSAFNALTLISLCLRFFSDPRSPEFPIQADFSPFLFPTLILFLLICFLSLLLGIFAITEEYNTQAPQANSSALIIGLLVTMIGAGAGYLEGWPINPARDLGPRTFAYFAGWGPAAFPAPGNYWWVPIAGPFCGGLVGASAYQWLIRPFLPSRFNKSAATAAPGEPEATS